MRQRYPRLMIGAVAVSALLVLTGAKCNPGGHASSGTGAFSLEVAPVGYGNPPADVTVRPVGVAITGRHAGLAVWVMAGAAAAAGVGAVTDKAIRAVGGDPLAMTGNPCKDEPPGKKIAAWKRSSVHRHVFLDCAAWEHMRGYADQRIKDIGMALRCITHVVTLGVITPGAGQGARYVYDFPGLTGGAKGGIATLETDENGRITYAYVRGLWRTCAGIAK